MPMCQFTKWHTAYCHEVVKYPCATSQTVTCCVANAIRSAIIETVIQVAQVCPVPICEASHYVWRIMSMHGIMYSCIVPRC